MEFAGSNFLVPLLLIIAASSFIAFEIWRRASLNNKSDRNRHSRNKRGKPAAKRGTTKRSLFGTQTEAEPATEEIVAWHRQFEQAIYRWFELTEAVIAHQNAVSLRPTLEAVAIPEPADTEITNQNFLQAAQSHPSATKHAELLLMYDTAQAAFQELVANQSEAASNLLADYRSLRNVWVERLRQVSLDDTFALRLLAIQRK